MNKALLYIAAAIIFGLAMTLLPTWLYLVQANQQETFAEALARFAQARELPLLQYSEKNHVDPISLTEVEIFGLGFVVAVVAYVLVRRKTRRYDYVWPPMRPY